MTSMIKKTAKATLIATFAIGAVLVSLASQAKTEAEIHQIDLEGETFTVACDSGRLNDIWVQYARCKEIFDGEQERETAETYCKPLAVAQACTVKNVPTI